VQEGRSSAFHDGRELSPEWWSAKYQISVGNDGDVRLRRQDVLALFRRAMETLFDNGEIKMQPYDRKGGKHRCIIRCADPEEAIFDEACTSPAKAVE
jgi:hypothetical protein